MKIYFIKHSIFYCFFLENFRNNVYSLKISFHYFFLKQAYCMSFLFCGLFCFAPWLCPIHKESLDLILIKKYPQIVLLSCCKEI